MSTNPPPQTRVRSLDAVVNGFETAWHWMRHVMWESPEASWQRWFHFGWIALLAGLAPHVGGSGSNQIGDGGSHSTIESILPDAWASQFLWLTDRGFDLGLVIAAIVLFAILFCLVLFYIRTRFRLVMLDNVLTGRPRIRGPFGATSGPAHRYLIAELALWLLALPLAIAPLALTLAPTLISLVKDGARYAEEPSGASLFALITFSLVWCLPILLLAALASGVLHAFVVPYWHRGTSLGEGLARAWRLIVARPAAFLIFAGLRFVAGVAAWLLSLVAAVVCCCVTLPCLGGMVGFSILSTEIPFGWLLVSPFVLTLWVFAAWLYSSILAPVPVLMRGWSYEFLRQLDPELPPLGRPPAASDPGV